MKKIVLTVLAAATLTACGSFNHVDNQGKVHGELKWPAIEKVSNKTAKASNIGVDYSEGVLKNLRAGMSKTNVFELLGRPQFAEGLFGVREWNYVVNRHTPNGIEQCQLKFLFDKNDNVTSYHWKDASCATPQKVVHVVEEMPKPIRQLSLQGEFLFDFNSANLSNQGKRELSKLVDFLSVSIEQGNQYNGIRIVGYTDPLGSEGYNQNLSERRAQSVAAYLAEHGVPRHAISAIGAGESNQVKTCDAHKGKKASTQLKECLRENRRVNITVY